MITSVFPERITSRRFPDIYYYEFSNYYLRTLKLVEGTQVSHYKILSGIGKGGMGEVYLGLDTELDRKVAIKFLSDEFSNDPDKLSRFVQEAKSASALNHPNILTVYEIGEHESSRYIATEFVEGESLRQLLEKESCGPDTTLDIGVQIAEALASAHEAGIIHRDIKPENIMIRTDGYAKLLDFGLAKLLEKRQREGETPGAGKQDATLNTASPDPAFPPSPKTSPGTIMGTARYMSPEQAKGHPTDARSDIFSFGIVMFEMLTGSHPFEGETAMDVLASIINQEARPLPEDAGLDEFATVCERALAKEPSERFQSARELLQEIENLRGGKSGLSIHEDETVQFETISDASPASNMPDIRRDTLLLTDFSNHTGDEVFDNTLKLALEITLAQSPSIDVFPEMRVRNTLGLMGHSADDSVDAGLAREICLREQLKAYICGTIANLGSVYMLTLEAVNANTGDTIARKLEQAESKEKVLDALGAAATGLRKELGESLSSIEKYDVPLDKATTNSLDALKFFTMGTRHHVEGKPLEAIPYYKRAVETDPEFAYAYGALAVMYQMMKQPRVAAEYASKAYVHKDRTSKLEQLRLIYFYHSMATGDLEKAIENLKIYKETYPRDERPCINLCWTYSLIGKFQEALEAAEEAVRINPNHVIGQGNLISTLIILNRFDEAKAIYEKIDRLGLVKDPVVRELMIQIAFVEEDLETLQVLIDSTINDQESHYASNWQAETAAFFGKLREAAVFSAEAVDFAIDQDAKECAAQYLADRNLRSVFVRGFDFDQEFVERLSNQVRSSISLAKNQSILAKNAISLALVNDIEGSNKLILELRMEYPKDYVVNAVWIPCVEAAIHFRVGNADEAINELKPVERFESAAEFIPQYLRGLAYLESGRNENSKTEFQKILDHRGEAPLSTLYPLAQLGKARAGSSKEDLKRFFEIWKDADDDAPPLLLAKELSADLD